MAPTSGGRTSLDSRAPFGTAKPQPPSSTCSSPQKTASYSASSGDRRLLPPLGRLMSRPKLGNRDDGSARRSCSDKNRHGCNMIHLICVGSGSADRSLRSNITPRTHRGPDKAGGSVCWNHELRSDPRSRSRRVRLVPHQKKQPRTRRRAGLSSTESTLEDVRGEISANRDDGTARRSCGDSRNRDRSDALRRRFPAPRNNF